MTNTLRGHGEMVAYLPYLLGFVPRDSVVVVGLGATGIGPVSRIDVPSEAAGIGDAARRVVDQLSGAPIGRVELIGFHDELNPRRLMTRVARELRRRTPFAVAHHLLVQEQRWMTLRCACGRCQVGVEQLVPAADTVAAVAEQVVREVEPYADREDLVASLEPTHPLILDALRALQEQPGGAAADLADDVQLARAWQAVLEVADGAPPVRQLPVPVLARAMTSLRDKQIRDELMGWIAPHALRLPIQLPTLVAAFDTELGRPTWRSAPPDSPDVDYDVAVRRVTRRLQALVRCTPPEWVDPVATLLAFWCWAHGSGALAGIALDYALDTNPAYSMAQLLQQMLTHGLRPQDMRSTPREIAS